MSAFILSLCIFLIIIENFIEISCRCFSYTCAPLTGDSVFMESFAKDKDTATNYSGENVGGACNFSTFF